MKLKEGWLKALFPIPYMAMDRTLGTAIKPEVVKQFKDLAFPTADMKPDDAVKYAENLVSGDIPFMKDWAEGKEGTFGIDGAIMAFVMPLIFSVVYPVLGELVNRYILLNMRPVLQQYRLDPSMVATLFYRQHEAPEHIKDWFEDLRDQGWSKGRIDALYEAMRPLLGLGEIKDLFLRGELGEDEQAHSQAVSKITSWGYSEGDANDLIKLFYYIPPVSDLIRMVVREAWRDDIAESFGTDEDYPETAIPDFRKAGVSPEWLRRYWRAHWELPSIGNAFDMFHRIDAESTDPKADSIALPSGASTKNVIGIDTLQDLLRIQDVMPFWREPLIKIAYQPITRVDVRRLYKTGVIDEDEVYICYRNLGYDHTNASRMTDFTKKYYPREEETPEDEARSLTKSETLRMYQEQVLDEGEARTRLIAIDYPPELAELLISLEDVKKAREDFKTELSYIDDAYVMGVITRGDLIARLGALDLPATQSDAIIASLDRKKLSKAVRPTPAEFKAWLKKKIITVDQFTEEMTTEGYQQEYIDKYIQEIKG